MKRAVAVTTAIAGLAVLGAAASGDRLAAPYHIRFSAVVGNERFATIAPAFLRFYVFGITLIGAAGKSAPAARYVAIRFVVGVPQSLDHDPALVNPPVRSLGFLKDHAPLAVPAAAAIQQLAQSPLHRVGFFDEAIDLRDAQANYVVLRAELCFWLSLSEHAS